RGARSASAPAPPGRAGAATTNTRPEQARAPAPRDGRPAAPSSDDLGARREKLKERLRNVREHPRPEPLPTSVAAAGVLVVERIAPLQTELDPPKSPHAALPRAPPLPART